MILACHPQWPQVNVAGEGTTATALWQISRWLREKRVCNLDEGGRVKVGVKCCSINTQAAQAIKITFKVKFGRHEERGTTRMPPSPHSIPHSQSHSQTHSYSHSHSHWPSLHALRKLNSLGEIYAPSRLLCPERRRHWSCCCCSWRRRRGRRDRVWMGIGQATVRYQALCVVAFRTQRNMQQGGRQAAATGNWEIYALFCLAKHATSILVNFSCTAGPGYIRVVPCTDIQHPYRNGHSRFDAELPRLTHAKCKIKQNKGKEKPIRVCQKLVLYVLSCW